MMYTNIIHIVLHNMCNNENWFIEYDKASIEYIIHLTGKARALRTIDTHNILYKIK